MDATDFLSKIVTVSMDRPLGSRHPRHGFIYPVNYGFIAGVPAPDGHDLDAYVLGIAEPVAQFTGRCIAVLRRLDDNDDKLIVVLDGKDYSDAHIRTLTEFQEKWFSSVILRQPQPTDSTPLDITITAKTPVPVLSPSLLGRMRRVDPTFARRYHQRSGQ